MSRSSGGCSSGLLGSIAINISSSVLRTWVRLLGVGTMFGEVHFHSTNRSLVSSARQKFSFGNPRSNEHPQTPASPSHSSSCLSYSFLVKMRVQSLIRAQSLASSGLRTAARTVSRTPSRCALSTAAASRTPFTSGLKTDTWINNQQKRWQSAAAQV